MLAAAMQAPIVAIVLMLKLCHSNLALLLPVLGGHRRKHCDASTPRPVGPRCATPVNGSPQMPCRSESASNARPTRSVPSEIVALLPFPTRLDT
jgi:hypothetical protein